MQTLDLKPHFPCQNIHEKTKTNIECIKVQYISFLCAKIYYNTPGSLTVALGDMFLHYHEIDAKNVFVAV